MKRLLIAGLLLTLVVPTTAAQDAAQTESEPPFFAEKVEVNVVNIEVMVTDKKGRHIEGLTAEEFQILEDGKPVEITNFYTRQAQAVLQQDDDSVDDPPRRRLASIPAPPPDQQLNLVVYVDNFNIRPFDRNRVFRSLRHFLLENIGPHDRVMLVAYNRSVKVLTPFTSDPAAITSEINELENFAAMGLQAEEERQDILNEIERVTEENYSNTLLRIRQYAQSASNDLSFTIDALRKFIDPLAGLPGRKAILHVSGGFPMIPGQEFFYAVREQVDNVSVMSEISAFDASRRIQELASAANANRVTFYTIDASGLQTYGSDSVERKGAGWETLGPLIDSNKIHNYQSSIRLLADVTGGIAIINTNDAGPGLERVADDFKSFYSLGFVSGDAVGGRYHKLEVKVNRPGLTVRHREGYRTRSIDALMIEGTQSVLLFGVQNNPAGISVEATSQSRRDDGMILVTFEVKVPFEQIVMVPRSEVYQAQIRLFMSAMDEKGGTSPVEEAPIPIRIPSEYLEAALKESLVYETQLLMKPGSHKIAVGLRDDLGETSSFVSRFLVVGKG